MDFHEPGEWNNPEEKTDKALRKTIERLEILMKIISISEKKLAGHGSLHNLKKLLYEKKKRGINPVKLAKISKEVQEDINECLTKNRSL